MKKEEKFLLLKFLLTKLTFKLEMNPTFNEASATKYLMNICYSIFFEFLPE